jgi:hypothetical protein
MRTDQLEQWHNAITLAEAGRPQRLSEMVLREIPPPAAREALALYILRTRSKNTGRPKAETPSATLRRQFHGRALYRQLLAKGYDEGEAMNEVQQHDRKSYPRERPFSEGTWDDVFNGKRDSRFQAFDESAFSQEASLG